MRYLLLVSPLVLLVALVATGQEKSKPQVRIVLAGDSTVTDNSGWGLGFAKAMNEGASVINLSRGGRSSKSYRDEGWWQKVFEAKPTYVLIQFGHNDQPGKGPERETDPKTTFRENLGRYVDEARGIGAKPVLVTSLSRRRWAEDGIHIRSNLTDYVEATKAVAKEKNVPLIDLHARSIEVYESLGQKGCALISPNQPDGTLDHTHLNSMGSDTFGPIIARDLQRAVPELKEYVRGEILQEKTPVATQPATAPTSGVPAFPGAEGFGASASGGRGGRVYTVTNLDDSGSGSLRDAVREPNRTVVFAVSGTIDLKTTLRVQKPNITLAGQTAPGDGICLRGKELMIVDAENVIVRFLRIRPGDELKQEHDALSIRNSQHVIVDHCSMSWSTDSLNDVTHTSGNVTVQWCILSEPLNNSVHVKGAHGYGTGWDGRIIDGKGGGGSYHHNLIAHCASRAPRIGYYKQGRGLIDCRNNVIYNCGPSYGGETDDFNYVANYYRPGPSSQRPVGNLFDIWSDDSRMYITDNVFEGGSPASANNRLGVSFRKGNPDQCLVNKPFPVAPIATDPAKVALEHVLVGSGATLPARDAVDQRIINDAQKRTGAVINSQSDVGGWPELKSKPAPKDSDGDGMPDEWETAHKINPSDASDSAALAHDGYTNLEYYLNELAKS